MEEKRRHEMVNPELVEAKIYTRRDFLVASSVAVTAAALPLGCGAKGDEKKSGSAADESAQGTPWAELRKAVDLGDSLHLADIHHHGEFVDFGTAARYKYTLGGWMSGWDNDTSMNGMTYTWASTAPSRLYFSVDEATPLSLVIRAQKGGTDSFSAYLNDIPIARISFKTSGWEEHRIEVAQEQVVRGENALKFVYTTATKIVGGQPASIAVDYLRIIPAGQDYAGKSSYNPPRQEVLKQRYKTDDKEREVLLLSFPTTLRYYLDVPKGGQLCLTAAVVGIENGKKGEGTLVVRGVPVDDGKPLELTRKTYADASWHSEMIDLSPVAGRFARLDVEVSGTAEGRIALSDAAIRVAPPQISASNNKVKNVIVLLIDTLRADHLGVYRKTRVKTPAFDKFTKESTLFERCQAPSNWTKPSCATVLTGLYPDTHKALGHSSTVNTSSKLASEFFQTAGFATGAFIANGYLAAEFGFKRGWNEYVNFIRENKPTEAEHVYKRALEFITANKEKPFFTYLQTIDPHVPYDPPDEDLKLYDAQPYEGPVKNRSTGELLEQIKRKKIELNPQDRKHLEALYDGEITYHDRHFGRFLDELNKLGILNNTAIVVCSDHGEEFFDHESVGHGHTLYQELLHVPFVIRAPGLVPAGKRIVDPVGLSDILPTVLTAAAVPVAKEIEGRNLLPLCNGELADPLGASFSSFFSDPDSRNLAWAVRKGNFKLYMRGPARSMLFHLGNDPKELLDADEQYPIALRALRIALGQFIAAPAKRQWTCADISSQVVTAPNAPAKEADMPEDLKQQLRALGYIQ